MERVQRELFEAAAKGNVSSLHHLLIEDPLLLERVTPSYNSETALHVSALLGHLDFVKQILAIKPELTHELNSQRSSPLHLASAKGHAHVVRELLSVVGHETTCLAQDKDGLTPLHLAAIKGRVEVMELLLRAQPDAARLTLYGGETILHLCVKNCHPEALKLLIMSSVSDPEFVRSKDGEGNTLLHLAVEHKQVESINLLLERAAAAAEVDVINAVNHKGLTAMDVLIRSRSDVRDSEISDSLKRAGGDAGASMADKRDDEINPLMKQFHKIENAIMVVASVVAAMAFQIAVNPPGGVWQDDNYLFDRAGNTVDPLGNRISHAVDSHNRSVLNPHRAGYSILATNDPDLFLRLCDCNAGAYYSSIITIILLVTGLASTNRFFAFILTVASGVALQAAMWTYDMAAEAWMPSKEYAKTFNFHAVEFALIYFLTMGEVGRQLIRRIRSRRRCTAASSAVPENNTRTIV